MLFDERTELPGLALINAGISRALATSPDRVEIYRETIDSSRFGSPAHKNVFHEYLRGKYAGKRIDVAVAVMQPALDFLLTNRTTLFTETPIVFCGIERRAFGNRWLPPSVTGVLVNREFAPTLKLALKLHPGTKRIMVVSGNSDFDKSVLEFAKQEFRAFENQYSFTYRTGKPLRDLLPELAQLPPHTLVLYTTMFQDSADESYIPHEVAERISAAANAPVYGFLDQYLGHGIVGGQLYSVRTHGEATGELVSKIIRGSIAADVRPIEPESNITMFDGRQLKRWKINEASLPSASTVLFREPTAWQRHKKTILVTALIVLVQLAVFSFLVMSLFQRHRAQRSLIESELRFCMMANAAPIMIWTTGPDGNCTFLSKGWLDFTNQTLEEGLGNGWLDAVHPDDRAATHKTYEDAFKARQPFTMEYRLRGRGGDYAWVMDTGVPRFLADRTFAGYVGSTTDITVIKHNQERWRSVVEAAPNAMLVANAEGKITLVNARAEEMFGYTRAELIGSSMSMLISEPSLAQFPSHWERTSPDSPAPRMSPRSESFARRKDGTHLPVEIGLNRIRTRERQFTIASILDITERLAAEAKLRESEERMTVVTDAAHLGMWIWEPPATGMWASEKWRNIHGYSSDAELRYESLIERIHPEDRDTVEGAIADAFNEGGPFHMEHRILLPSGDVRWIANSGRLEEKTEDGLLRVRMLGISIDITERVEAEEAAREVSGKLITAQEDERRRIARELHDDLNQRLALLSVETDLLGRMDNEPSAQALILDIGKRIQDLSSEVHKLSYQLHPAKLEQLGLVSALRSFCRELSTQCGIPVEFLHEDVPRDLDVDIALCLYRIVQESLQNMVRHSGASRAQVQLNRKDGHMFLVVSDNGRGFDINAVGSRAGLGLVSMRERVRQVNGVILFKSELNAGTRVEVAVPFLDKPKAAAQCSVT